MVHDCNSELSGDRFRRGRPISKCKPLTPLYKFTHFITLSATRTINNLILNLWSHHNAPSVVCGCTYCKCWPLDKTTEQYKVKKKKKKKSILSQCATLTGIENGLLWTMMLCENATIMYWFHKGNPKTANPNHLFTYSSRWLSLNVQEWFSADHAEL